MNARALAVLTLTFTIATALGGCRSGTNRYICRSRQAEAQASLKGLHTSELAYKAQNGRYSSSMSELGFTPATSRYYDLKIDTSSEGAYSATATGKDQSSGDIWTIDQTGAPVAKTDKCTQ